MGINLIHNNNIGCICVLLLIILLSQSKILNFLLDTALGRAFLILFILYISYCNKILGIISVLFIIIIFNNSNFGYYMEGFDTTTPSQDNTTTSPSDISTSHSDTSSTTNAPNTTNASNTTSIDKKEKSQKLSTKSSEGFDILGTENNIKRGKQSNSIPINKSSEQSEYIQAYDGSFKDNYSSF